MTRTTTDNILPVIKLYIEGVQVPFENIVINQGVGTLPSAAVVVPPQAFLMDISKFYQPKVHIFYLDPTSQPPYSDPTKPVPVTSEKDLAKLLFTGVIAGVSYNKAIGPNYGNVSIQFQCVHKNHFMGDLLLDYTSWRDDPVAQQQDGGFKVGAANTQASSFHALAGLESTYDSNKEITPEHWKETEGRTITMVQASLSRYLDKLQGMTGCIVNYWNQLKRAAFGSTADIKKSLNLKEGITHDGFLKIYKPLIETGLQFFDRLSGHPFLESKIEASRVDPCPSKATPSIGIKVLVPPSHSLMVQNAAQTELSLNSLNNYLQDSGEITHILQLFTGFYAALDYEMVTLSSPSNIPLVGGKTGETTAIETIVKPVLPFYFSPICNVFLPGMYSSLSVSYDDLNVPTRIGTKQVDNKLANPLEWGNRVRAPHSIREAIYNKLSVDGQNLLSTTGYSYGAIGKFEQGRGIKNIQLVFPQWLAYLSRSMTATSKTRNPKDPSSSNLDASNETGLADLSSGWNKRYPNQPKLNPYSDESGLKDHQKLLVSEADYIFTKTFAGTKAGRLECPFNPYVVPGYPLDILEASPILPSYHAHCVSVSHHITESSIGTSVTFSSAVTYSELINYYIPFMHPYLQVAFQLADSPTLVSDPSAKGYSSNAIAAADDFYIGVFDIGAADPTTLYDFNTGMVNPVDRKNGLLNIGTSESKETSWGEELNPNLTYQGNMRLVSRPIETQTQIEDRFKLKFIDMVQSNYNPTVIKYVDQFLQDSKKLEIGQSQFLSYREDINKVPS